MAKDEETVPDLGVADAALPRPDETQVTEDKSDEGETQTEQEGGHDFDKGLQQLQQNVGTLKRNLEDRLGSFEEKLDALAKTPEDTQEQVDEIRESLDKLKDSDSYVPEGFPELLGKINDRLNEIEKFAKDGRDDSVDRTLAEIKADQAQQKHRSLFKDLNDDDYDKIRKQAWEYADSLGLDEDAASKVATAEFDRLSKASTKEPEPEPKKPEGTKIVKDGAASTESTKGGKDDGPDRDSHGIPWLYTQDE